MDFYLVWTVFEASCSGSLMEAVCSCSEWCGGTREEREERKDGKEEDKEI